MPDLPTDSVQVQPTISPSTDLPANATEQAFGAGVGEAIQQGADVLTRRAELEAKRQQEAQIHADQTVMMNGANQLSDFETEMHAPSGILNQRLGMGATAAVDKTLNDYQKRVDQIASGLTDEDQKQRFQNIAAEHGRQVRGKLYAYETGEVNKFQNDTATAFIGNNLNAIARNPEDVQAVNEKAQLMRDAAEATAKRNGLPEDGVKLAGDSAVADGYYAQIKSLSDGGHDQMAAAAFEANKDKLDARTLGPAQRMVDSGSTAGEAQRILHDFTLNKEGQPIPYSEFLNRVENDQRLAGNVKLRDEVEKRGEKFLSDHEKAIIADQRQNFDVVQRRIMDPENTQGILAPDVQNMKGLVSPEQWGAAERLAEKGITEPDATAVYYAKLALADPATRDQLSKQDLTRLGWSPLSKGFKEVEAMQIEVRKNGVATNATGTMTKEEIINAAIRSAGIDLTSSPSMTTRQNADKLRIAINDQVEATENLPQNQGKKLTPKEIRDIADSVRVQAITVPGTIYGTNSVPRYLATPEQMAAAVLPTPPIKGMNPDEADQAIGNMRTQAGKMGLNIDHISQDQYKRAVEKAMQARQYEKAGNIKARNLSLNEANAILLENQTSVNPKSRAEQALENMRNY